MRHSVRNMRVKDLPLPDQQWWYQGDRVLINFIGADRYTKVNHSCRVCWTYIDSNGKATFRKNLGQGPSQVCDGSIELGRFLHEGKKVV